MKVFFSGGFGRLFFFVHFDSGFQIVGFLNLVLSLQFSFLSLVNVLVNFRFWSIGFSFGQVKLAQVLFFGFVHGWFCRFSKPAQFLWSIVLANCGFHLVSKSLNQFRFGLSKLSLDYLALWKNIVFIQPASL